MLTKGNSKLGGIWNWSIPAKKTCPGKSKVCAEICYGLAGCYLFDSTKRKHEENWALARSGNLVERIVNQIILMCIRLVRIHAVGDFFSVSYTRRWARIIAACPDTEFFAYTRSHTVTKECSAKLVEEVRKLAQYPNMHLWLSCDRSMPQPPRWESCGIAYVMCDDDDIPPYEVDLVFRDSEATPLKRVNKALVCPNEQGFGVKVKCETCQLCFNPQRQLLKLVATRSANVEEQSV